MTLPRLLVCGLIYFGSGYLTAQIGSGPVIPTPVPEPAHVPLIQRDVTLILDQAFTRPHIPAMRVSSDGRIAVRSKPLGGGAAFYLIEPEKLQQPLMESGLGIPVFDATPQVVIESFSSLFGGAGSVGGHVTLCDPTEAFTRDFKDCTQPPPRTNPYPCGTGNIDDCYDLTIIAGIKYTIQDEAHQKLWSRMVTVRVSNPKTAQAEIEDVFPIGAAVDGGVYFQSTDMFELTVTGDGQLLTGRIGRKDYQWTNPQTGLPQKAYTNIIYSYNNDFCKPCDVTAWDLLSPISHAYHQPEVRDRYGFASYPLRDPEGNFIPDGYDILGTYPWLDKSGRNLFFTMVNSTLSYDGWDNTRYPTECPPDEPDCTLCPPNEPKCADERTGKTRGHAFAGLWSQGKMVLLDDTLNNTDYGLEAKNRDHRMVTLYEPDSGQLGNEEGKVRLGAGRDNTVAPPGSAANTTILDSTEHLLHFWKQAQPVTARDVVWIVNNGKSSEEVIFDDYLHVDGFILSNMAGALTYPSLSKPPHVGSVRVEYHDGWSSDDQAFTQTVRVQNAAPGWDRWNVPVYGEAFGEMRLEPAALGGVHGKGLWLGGDGGIEYQIPSQPDPSLMSSSDWSFSLFVDPRFGNDNVYRWLLHFPDGSNIRMRGRDKLIYRSGGVTHTVVLPYDAATPKQWSHFSIHVLDQGMRMLFYYNGYLLDDWQSSGPAFFRMQQGSLIVGYENGSKTSGFVGWIDDFNVFAAALSPEETCNQANGTLIGFADGAGGSWDAVADLYPQSSHDRISSLLVNSGQPAYDCYVCYHDYSDDYAAHTGNIPTGTASVRTSLLFPEGPLFHDAPRPDSSLNPFCLTCHAPERDGPLSVDVLVKDPTKTAAGDPRRQPLQPFRRVFGNLPEDWLGAGLPASPVALDSEGMVIDTLLQPSVVGFEPQLVSYTLVDAATGQDLFTLTNGMSIDSSTLPASVNIRANLDSPQASVRLIMGGSSHTAGDPPYTLYGFSGGSYLGGTLSVGNHILQADILGSVIRTRIISFNVF